MELPNFSEEKIAQRLREKRAAKAGIKLSNGKEPEPKPEPTEKEDDSPLEHYLTPKVQLHLSLRNNLYLVGPAGSGKSKAAELAATNLSLPFYCPPIGRETTNAQLFGYFNVQGNYVRTPIREAAEKGGVLHLEEIDFASPAVGTALNALLANDVIGFPDQTISQHPDFVIIASANTYGTGATQSYIGSQGLNAATLDRFVFLPFPYDEKLELRISQNRQWTLHVQSIRRKVATLGLKHVISPRASIMGGKMCESKAFSWEEIESQVLFKGLDPMTVDKIRNAISI